MNSEKQVERFADVRRHLPFLACHEGWASLLEKLLCYPRIRQAFKEADAEAHACAEVARNPMAAVQRRLGMTSRLIGLEEQVPKTGPVVLVCNHAHGGADALALMAEVGRIRPDFKALANRETTLLAGVGPLVFPVSILGGDQAAENVASIRAMMKHVRQGGALGIFPAGRVAVWQGGRMRDPAWNEQVIKILQRMDATVVPLWFFGNPPPLIRLLSRFSRFVRTALIPTGLAKMAGREVIGRVGPALDSKELRGLAEDAHPWLRRRLESLSDSGN